MTYDLSAVSDTVIAHKKGITIQQGRALRDNQKYLQWMPYNDTGDGEYWDFAVDGALATLETPVFNSAFEYRMECVGLAYNNSSQQVRIDPYLSTDAAYVTGDDIVPATGTGTVRDYIDYQIESVNQSRNFFQIRVTYLRYASGDTSLYATPTVTTPLLFDSTAQTVTRLRLAMTGGGDIDEGKVYLYKRLAFV